MGRVFDSNRPERRCRTGRGRTAHLRLSAPPSPSGGPLRPCAPLPTSICAAPGRVCDRYARRGRRRRLRPSAPAAALRSAADRAHRGECQSGCGAACPGARHEPTDVEVRFVDGHAGRDPVAIRPGHDVEDLRTQRRGPVRRIAFSLHRPTRERRQRWRQRRGRSEAGNWRAARARSREGSEQRASEAFWASSPKNRYCGRDGPSRRRRPSAGALARAASQMVQRAPPPISRSRE